MLFKVVKLVCRVKR